VKTVALLLLSNTFMTFAWYGHLKFRNAPMIWAILVSWLIALGEYILMVPANRIGYGTFSAYQLKIMQEAITLTVFVGFAKFYLGESFEWRYVVAFGFLLCAVVAAFWNPA